MAAVTSELPARPDGLSGEPRPPRAPFIPVRGVSPDAKPVAPSTVTAPSGRGLTLEVRSDRRLRRLALHVTCIGIAAAIVTYSNGTVVWVNTSLAWVFGLMLVFGTLIQMSRGGQLAAGADWLQFKGSWVDLYELVEIRISMPRPSRTLTLVDRAGRKVRVDVAEVESNSQLWDLVYNGMLHSVHNGATFKDRTFTMPTLRRIQKERAAREAKPSQ